jgi:hypothetical protein
MSTAHAGGALGTNLALNGTWLSNTSVNGWCPGYDQSTPAITYWRQDLPTWTYATTDHRPIRLTIAEVERLRAAARRDNKIRAVLAKFTDQIEVVVDFE